MKCWYLVVSFYSSRLAIFLQWLIWLQSQENLEIKTYFIYSKFIFLTSVSGDYPDDSWGNSKMFSSTDQWNESLVTFLIFSVLPQGKKPALNPYTYQKINRTAIWNALRGNQSMSVLLVPLMHTVGNCETASLQTLLRRSHSLSVLSWLPDTMRALSRRNLADKTFPLCPVSVC